MAMVGVDSGSLHADSQPKSSGLVLSRRPLGAVLHSSNELGELSQWLCHDDSTINIVELLLLYEGRKKLKKLRKNGEADVPSGRPTQNY